jgi:hypothetical protein
MDIFEYLNDNIDIEKLKVMIFLFNALENGWNIRKSNNSYIFNKKHNGKKEVFSNNYLTTFIEENSNIKKILLNMSSEIG